MSRVYLSNFQAAIKTASVVVPTSKHGLPILKTVRLTAESGGDKVFIGATDLELALTVHLPSYNDGPSWAIAVPPMIGGDKAPDVIADLCPGDNNTLHIDGHVRQVLKGYSVEEFPALPVLPPAVACGIDAKQLKRAIAFLSEATSTEREQYAAVYSQIDGRDWTLTALDGYRVHRARIKVEAGATYTAAIPVTLLKKLARLISSGAVDLHADEARIGFAFTNSAGLRCEISSAWSATTPPAYETLLQGSSYWSICLEVEGLRKACKIAKIFSPSCELSITRHWADWLTAHVTLYAESEEIGSATQPLAASYNLCPSNVKFELKTDELLDAVGKIQTAVKIEAIGLRWSIPSAGLFVEGQDETLALSALIFPVLPKSAYRQTFGQRAYEEEKKQAEEQRRGRCGISNLGTG
jgi:DNA polymerase III sliding clamp (beta) subunit (PCNA family)